MKQLNNFKAGADKALDAAFIVVMIASICAMVYVSKLMIENLF